jgi:ribosomal protein S18 acetylase RimI-like enzyme
MALRRTCCAKPASAKIRRFARNWRKRMARWSARRSIRRSFRPFGQGAGVYVSDLWVSEATRGKGLGRRLLRAVADDAGRSGARFLKLVVYDDNPDARAFYDRLGFSASQGETILTLDETGLAALKDDRGTR